MFAGAFFAMPPREAAIYGITAALNAATLHTLDPYITRAMARVASSNSGSGRSYAWLQALKGLGCLQDLHLDMPLVLPGQVSALLCLCWLSTGLRQGYVLLLLLLLQQHCCCFCARSSAWLTAQCPCGITSSQHWYVSGCTLTPNIE
jgi:hypothetical protein